ncbi:MAG TPA: cell division protein FtsZ, partial [Ruegeria sp.]|nr:cell division protein FtsZ [Ruegeria sp.]
PSPEAMRRLQAAAQKAPSAPQQGHRALQQPVGDKPRFGFNRLIDRMTGHAPDTPADRGPAVARKQPVMRPSDATAPAHAEADPDQERIEIPAFLRRQAN